MINSILCRMVNFIMSLKSHGFEKISFAGLFTLIWATASVSAIFLYLQDSIPSVVIFFLKEGVLFRFLLFFVSGDFSQKLKKGKEMEREHHLQNFVDREVTRQDAIEFVLARCHGRYERIQLSCLSMWQLEDLVMKVIGLTEHEHP